MKTLAIKPDRVFKLALLFLLAAAAFFSLRTHAASNPSITIDSPSVGESLPDGVVRFSGTFVDVYDIKLIINAEKQVDVVMNAPGGNDSGTWYYDFDASVYDGDVMVVAKGSDIETRYGAWTPTFHYTADHPLARSPQVAIVNPADGGSVNGTVPIRVSVSSPNEIRSVQIRVDHGPWVNALHDGTTYVYDWNTNGIGDKTVSIEAKAADSFGNTGFTMSTYAKVGLGTNEPLGVPSMQNRAMWIWESETYKLLLNPGSRTVLDKLAQDTATFGSESVATFYLAVGPYAGMDILEDDPGKLRDFIAWAHAKGYKVQACIAGGTTPPFMGAYEVFHDKAIREIERIINYNLAAGTDERFDGVNVDIEPYISPDFKASYPSLQIQYLDGLQKMIDRIRTAGIDLPFGPAIPKWFDTNDPAKNITWHGSTKWLSEHIQDISDYISIMDYRDTADGSAGIIEGARGEIAYANAIGKPRSVIIGVETKDIANSGDPYVISFNHYGRATMETELRKVNAAFANDLSYGGIAMHHYDDIRKLPSDWSESGVFWEPPADAEPPGAVSKAPVAKALDYQQIRIDFGMAPDNYDVDRYIVYRGTESGFTPGPGNVAGLARSLSFTDIGLLPNTTYYYKVAAMDLKGNVGPVSAEASARTAGTTLKPMILTGLNVTFGSGKATAKMQVVDKETSRAITGAKVEGRFNFGGGKYTNGAVDGNGWISFTSETVATGYQIGFEPRRITGVAGYYWAQAYDQPHITAYYPQVGLSGLGISTGNLSPVFSKNNTSYTATVPNEVRSIRVTPTAAVSGSVITVNGRTVASGTASLDIALVEGDNLISVIVAGSKGETDVYTVKVTRKIYVDNVFAPVADTYVHQNLQTTNYGKETSLEVLDVTTASGIGKREAYMKFDFGQYSDPIQSAVLNFYVSELAFYGTNKSLKVDIYPNSNTGWNENTITYSTRLTGETKLGTVTVDKPGWYSFDATSYVKTRMSADKKATFRFVDMSTQQVLIKINSRENEANQPYVMVNPSGNANLRSLSLESGAWSTAFDGSADHFTVSVAHSVDSVTVKPIVDETHGKAAVNGTAVASGQTSAPIPLKVGDNTIQVVVTAQNGTPKIYTVAVSRQLPNNANLDNLTISDGTLTPGFQADIRSYTATVTNSVYVVRVTPELADPLATVTVDGTEAISGEPSQDIPLIVGVNVVNVAVTAQNGDIRTYDITVTRQPSADASLKSLTVDNGMLTPGFDPNVMRYAATVTNSVYAITVTVAATDSSAVVAVNGNIMAGGDTSATLPLNIGRNTIRISVMAPNGQDTAEYAIVVTRQSSDARLGGLSVSEGALTPAFRDDLLHYSVMVTNSVQSIKVAPLAADANATVKVNDAEVAFGSASAVIPLNAGLNVIAVQVTAQDGTTVRNYVIEVTREAPSTPQTPDDQGKQGNAEPLSPVFAKRTAHIRAGGSTIEIDTVRTTGANEAKVDAIVLNQPIAAQLLAEALANADKVVSIWLDADPSNKAEQYEITVMAAFAEALAKAKAKLEIVIADMRIELPTDSLAGLVSASKDAIFRFEPVEQENKRKEVVERVLHSDAVLQAAGSLVEKAKATGIPMQIETNFTGQKTKLIFPITASNSDPAQYIFAVYIEHSDGEKVLREGNLVTDAGGRPTGIEIEIEKFSTFTPVQLPKMQIVPNNGTQYRQYIFGYEDGTFRPEQYLTRAELASLLNGLLDDEPSKPADDHAGRTGFQDVPSTHWAETAINRLTAIGIFEGRASDRFAPDEIVTRAEMAAIAARWNGVKPSDIKPGFADAAGHWAMGWIAAGSEHGWLTGYEDGTFWPNREITRAEAVAIINRMTGRQPAANTEKPTWKDVSVEHWAYGNIEAASRND